MLPGLGLDLNGWTKKSAAPRNFERWLQEQRVALYRSATLARTALRSPLCEKPLRVYIHPPAPAPKAGIRGARSPSPNLGEGLG